MSNSQIHVGRNSVLIFFLTCMTQMKNDCAGTITVKMVNSIFENMYMYLKLQTLSIQELNVIVYLQLLI